MKPYCGGSCKLEIKLYEELQEQQPLFCKRTSTDVGQLRKHDLHEMHNLLYFLLLLRNKDTWGVLEALGGLGVNLGLEPEGHARAWWGFGGVYVGR